MVAIRAHVRIGLLRRPLAPPGRYLRLGLLVLPLSPVCTVMINGAVAIADKWCQIFVRAAARTVVVVLNIPLDGPNEEVGEDFGT